VNLAQLTVIVPTRNEIHNIPTFLRSLPPEVALIGVDASQDDTATMMLALRPDQTLVIRHSSQITEARQIGAEAARTPWLLFTDADVVFAPDYFERLLTFQGYDAIYGPKLSRDDFMSYYRWFGRGQQVLQQVGIPAVSGSNLLVSRRALNGAGGFDLRLTCNEDSELGWRIKQRGYRITFAPDLVVYARDHRRLRLGLARKTLHSLTRCLLLYLHLIPARWRSRDWGYWAHLPGANGALKRKRTWLSR
jgi:glycosyltransferase involved in cell wall biosynthesis